MRPTTSATALTSAAILAGALLAGCSSGATTTSSTSAGAPVSSSASAPVTSHGGTTDLPTRTVTPPPAPSPVALPAGHQWLTVPALHTRVAIPTTWKAVDLAALRDQKGTPAFATSAEELGYTEEELTDFTSSGAVAMAVGPDAGETAPNLLVRSVGGGAFTSGDQLTSAARGTTGELDAQSEPGTPAGTAVRGDFHVPADGLTIHSSQLAVTVGRQQDIITVSAADAETVKKVMDAVVLTYSPAS